jgi:hypothetical protein
MFFTVGEKKNIFIINLVGRIVEKSMGRQVEMPLDSTSRQRRCDTLPGIKAEPHQNNNIVGLGID